VRTHSAQPSTHAASRPLAWTNLSRLLAQANSTQLSSKPNWLDLWPKLTQLNL